MPVLGKVGLVNKGVYAAGKTYSALDFVKYNGSTFVALKSVKGVTPADDGTNWQYLARGAELALQNNLLTTQANTYALDAAQGPVIKAELDSLNDSLTTINETLASHSYFTLVNGESVSNTQKTVTLLNGRKLSDYTLLLMLVKRGGYYRTSLLMPRPLFNAGDALDITEVDSANVQRWYDLAYISNTQVRIQSSANVTDTMVYLYGINI